MKVTLCHAEDDPRGFSHFINMMLFLHSQLIKPAINYGFCMLQLIGSCAQAGVLHQSLYQRELTGRKLSTVADGVILNISRMVNGNRSRRRSVNTRSLQNTTLNPRVTGTPRSSRSAAASRGITSAADAQPICVKIKGSRE